MVRAALALIASSGIAIATLVCFEQQPVNAISARSWQVVASVGLSSALFTFLDGWLTGLTAGSFVLLALLAASAAGATNHLSMFLVPGISLGCLAHRWPTRSAVLLLLGAAFGLLHHWHDSVVLLIGAMLAGAARRCATAVVQSLASPITKVRFNQQRAFLVTSFIIGYVCIVVLFALAFTTVQHSVAGGAFAIGGPDGCSESNFGFGRFLYFSLLTITSAGNDGINAVHPAAKVLVGLELLSGLLWFSLYFALLMRVFEKGELQDGESRA